MTLSELFGRVFRRLTIAASRPLIAGVLSGGMLQNSYMNGDDAAESDDDDRLWARLRPTRRRVVGGLAAVAGAAGLSTGATQSPDGGDGVTAGDDRGVSRAAFAQEGTTAGPGMQTMLATQTSTQTLSGNADNIVRLDTTRPEETSAGDVLTFDDANDTIVCEAAGLYLCVGSVTYDYVSPASDAFHQNTITWDGAESSETTLHPTHGQELGAPVTYVGWATSSSAPIPVGMLTYNGQSSSVNTDFDDDSTFLQVTYLGELGG